MKKFNEYFLIIWYPIWSLLLAMCASITGVYLFSVIRQSLTDSIDTSQWYGLFCLYFWGVSYCMIIIWVTYKILWTRFSKFYSLLRRGND